LFVCLFVSRLFSQSVRQSVNKSVNESVIESVSQLVTFNGNISACQLTKSVSRRNYNFAFLPNASTFIHVLYYETQNLRITRMQLAAAQVLGNDIVK